MYRRIVNGHYSNEPYPFNDSNITMMSSSREAFKICEHFVSGKSLQSVADEHSLTIGQIHNILKGLNDDYRASLATAITTVMPLEYQASISLHKAVMNQALELGKQDKVDHVVRLQAMRTDRHNPLPTKPGGVHFETIEDYLREG